MSDPKDDTYQEPPSRLPRLVNGRPGFAKRRLFHDGLTRLDDDQVAPSGPRYVTTPKSTPGEKKP